MRRVHHEWFGLLLAPETPSDFSTLAGWVARAWGTAGWRGQASLCWAIDSSLTRRVKKREQAWVLGAGPPLDRVVREAEARLLGRARLAGHDERGSRVLSDLELLAVLQHHGAATRLLDCTFNAYVALWFACRGAAHRDDWGLLIGLDAAQARPILTADQRDLPMADLLAGLEAEKTFGLWRPAALSPRIQAQQGFFVFSPVVEEKWGSARFKGDELHETGVVPGLTLFAVSPDLKSLMRDQWEEFFGYTEERLFPDLDGFAQAHAAGSEFPPDFFAGQNLDSVKALLQQSIDKWVGARIALRAGAFHGSERRR